MGTNDSVNDLVFVGNGKHAAWRSLTLREAVQKDKIDDAELTHVLHQHVTNHGDERSRQLEATCEENEKEPRDGQSDGYEDILFSAESTDSQNL